ncbi:MAG: hypothetical protein IPP43_07750 [Chitinophagaceae bacterium]|nr:hypothetical protein [Chitinophagaceae bacterium]
MAAETATNVRPEFVIPCAAPRVVQVTPLSTERTTSFPDAIRMFTSLGLNSISSLLTECTCVQEVPLLVDRNIPLLAQAKTILPDVG